MSCRYPRPCSGECCDDLYAGRTITVGRIGRMSDPNRECPECFRIGGHERYCDKGN